MLYLRTYALSVCVWGVYVVSLRRGRNGSPKGLYVAHSHFLFRLPTKIRVLRDASKSWLPSHMLPRGFVLCETQAVGKSLGR